jgi:hypothetical protein
MCPMLGVMLRADMFVFTISIYLCNRLFGPLYRTACYDNYKEFFVHSSRSPTGPRHPHCWSFDITLRHTTLHRAPLDEWSARRRDLYITTHDTQKETDIHAPLPRRDSNPQSPTIERPHTRAVDLAVTRIGTIILMPYIMYRNYRISIITFWETEA